MMKYFSGTLIFFLGFEIWCLVFGTFSQAQESMPDGITMEQTIEFLNKKLGKDFKVELEVDHIENNHSQMIISFFKNGALYKKDKIYLQTLDASNVIFSDEEKVLILYCKGANEKGEKKSKNGCVERQVVEKKMIVHYARCTLDVGSDKKKIASLKKAFIHAIKLEQDKKYSSNVPFE